MAWNSLAGASVFVGTARDDYACYLEAIQEAPPVAFANRSLLEEWLPTVLRGPKTEQCGDVEDSLRVHGWLRDGSYYFDQLWAAASCKRYRDAMLWVAEHKYQENDLTGVDADHVVARTILDESRDAWVAIFPVYASSNRGSGRIERTLPKFNLTRNYAVLNSVAAFKIFNGWIPKSRADFDRAVLDVLGQHHWSPFVRDYLGRMCEEVGLYFKK